MNFCVAPREIREINKRGGQNKLQGVSKNHKKTKRPPPVYFEPESSVLVILYSYELCYSVRLTIHVRSIDGYIPE